MRSTLSLASPPPKNQTKQWPTEAPMEGWFPRFRGEPTRQRIALQWNCPRTESSDRATRNGSAAARAGLREPRLNSRPSSQNGSRRPDRRICGEWGSMSCAPTLWKEILAGFSQCPIIGILLSSESQGRIRPRGDDFKVPGGAARRIALVGGRFAGEGTRWGRGDGCRPIGVIGH
jgi:hypothetical protein